MAQRNLCDTAVPRFNAESVVSTDYVAWLADEDKENNPRLKWLAADLVVWRGDKALRPVSGKYYI